MGQWGGAVVGSKEKVCLKSRSSMKYRSITTVLLSTTIVVPDEELEV